LVPKAPPCWVHQDSWIALVWEKPEAAALGAYGLCTHIGAASRQITIDIAKHIII